MEVGRMGGKYGKRRGKHLANSRMSSAVSSSSSSSSLLSETATSLATISSASLRKRNSGINGCTSQLQEGDEHLSMGEKWRRFVAFPYLSVIWLTGSDLPTTDESLDAIFDAPPVREFEAFLSRSVSSRERSRCWSSRWEAWP